MKAKTMRRGSGLVVALALVLAALAGCAHFTIKTPYVARRGSDCQLSLSDGLAFVEVGGTPEEIGHCLGSMFRDEVRALVGRCLSAFGVGEAERARARALEPLVPEEYRRELAALGAAADVPYEDLLVANLVVDTRCSVVAAWGEARGGAPLAVGRNLDFHPAEALGRYTVVMLIRPEGRRPFVSVGWPGFNGATSAMNDAGLTGLILLQHHAPRAEEPGVPIGYRIRQALERAGDREEALAVYSSGPVSTGDFVVFADAQGAATVFQDPAAPGGFRTVRPRGDTLTCTNALMDEDDRQRDRRARRLDGLLADQEGAISAADLRHMLGAIYLPYLNVQAMVLVPEERRLQLALGSTFRPAATSDEWVEIELARWLDGQADAPATRPVADD